MNNTNFYLIILEMIKYDINSNINNNKCLKVLKNAILESFAQEEFNNLFYNIYKFSKENNFSQEDFFIYFHKQFRQNDITKSPYLDLIIYETFDSLKNILFFLYEYNNFKDLKQILNNYFFNI